MNERPLTPAEEAEISRAVERTQRRIDRAGKPKQLGWFDKNTGSGMTEEDEAGQ